MSTTLHVYVIGTDSYIAHSEDDAWELQEKNTGIKRGDEMVGDKAIQVPDGNLLKIFLEEGKPEFEMLTAAEWCAREGRGFLCSTDS